MVAVLTPSWKSARAFGRQLAGNKSKYRESWHVGCDPLGCLSAAGWYRGPVGWGGAWFNCLALAGAGHMGQKLAAREAHACQVEGWHPRHP